MPEMDLADELAELTARKEAGAISLAEFDRRKAALLVKPERPEPTQASRSLLLPVAVIAVIAVVAILALGGLPR